MIEKYNTEDIAEVIEYEGLEYAIRDYLTLDNIEDEELKNNAKECVRLMKWIENRVGLNN